MIPSSDSFTADARYQLETTVQQEVEERQTETDVEFETITQTIQRAISESEKLRIEKLRMLLPQIVKEIKDLEAVLIPIENLCVKTCDIMDILNDADQVECIGRRYL